MLTNEERELLELLSMRQQAQAISFRDIVDQCGLDPQQDFIGLSFNGYSLPGQDFSGFNLSDVSFVGADLSSSKFIGSKLTNADFENAILTNSDFTDANCENANFRGAKTTDAKFDKAMYANLYGSEHDALHFVYSKASPKGDLAAEYVQTGLSDFEQRPTLHPALPSTFIRWDSKRQKHQGPIRVVIVSARQDASTARGLSIALCKTGIDTINSIDIDSPTTDDITISSCIKEAAFVTLIWDINSPSSPRVNKHVRIAESCDTPIIPIVLRAGLTPPPSHASNSVLAFQDPGGWTGQFTSAISQVIVFWGSQESREGRDWTGSWSPLNKLAGSVVGAGAIRAIARALCNSI